MNRAVMACMFATPAVVGGLVFAVTEDIDAAMVAGSIGFLAGMVLAWTTWSVLTPRWRLWAYERVEDLDELKWQAFQHQLIWPDGHIFEKTEWRTAAQKQRLAELEQAWLDRRATDAS